MRKKLYFFLFLCISWANWHLFESIYTSKTNKPVDSKIYKNKIRAKLISAKIIAQSSSGSGVVFSKKDDRYSVITNRHVIDHSNNYQIQTFDSHVHKAALVCASVDNDLALLKFRSDAAYQLAKIDTSKLDVEKQLFAAGYPTKKRQIVVSIGKLLLYLDKPLKYGYQIGYDNQIDLGMSGGSIINSKGKVVGINGRSANPIIPDYQFRDGSHPNEQLKKKMTELSWGIPIAEAISLSRQSKCKL